MGLWRRQTGLFHWATSSSSPKHDARLGLVAGVEISAVQMNAWTKEGQKLKLGTGLQMHNCGDREGNGKKETLSEVTLLDHLNQH